MAIGYNYAPGADIPMNGSQNGQGGPSRLSPQQAVKILSLRVPESLPSNAPVNRALLTAPGGSAPGANALQSFIQAISQGRPSGVPGAPPSGPSAGPQQAAPSRPSAPGAPAQSPASAPSWSPYPMFDQAGQGFDLGGFETMWDLLMQPGQNLDPRQQALQQTAQQYYATPAQPKPQRGPMDPNFQVSNPLLPTGGQYA